MMILVTGASSSGKSALAERFAQELGGPLVYVATMHAYDAEGRRRVERHRAMRAGKGFETVERYTDVGGLDVPRDAVLLLECMSNLLANEMYDDDGSHENCVSKIVDDVGRLRDGYRGVVVVTNEVFGDGALLDGFCADYVDNLGRINCALARMADTVAESVVGIAVYHKKEGAAL
ncbi:MAG: bifunctional adenosylcobinamide kinase/adenosylcobinamide-phosphate guanylyltransferase [Clostridia bacterium]|nr:bifunctional adenosylcobinamide kinase/adenosylcobinamide-phosphate guanylyltransferase [Clostridia bacterium]